LLGGGFEKYIMEKYKLSEKKEKEEVKQQRRHLTA
jgi:hypothetical protein